MSNLAKQFIGIGELKVENRSRQELTSIRLKLEIIPTPEKW